MSLRALRPTAVPVLAPPQATERLHLVASIQAAFHPRRTSSVCAATEARGIPKTSDLATLGNLCVDIVLGVPELPPADRAERKAYMERLAASPPDKKYWEAGGNCNLAIAAARLGLRCVAIGHVGDEIYGHFLLDVLQEQGVEIVSMNENTKAPLLHSISYETLLCWVLVDPLQRHGFCSRSDFSEEPAYNWIKFLSESSMVAIKKAKVLFSNGYAFDELFPELIVSALDCAIEAGTAVFFDPGPRIKTLCAGTAEEQEALKQFLKRSDVLLLTSDEAESLTGIKNPIHAGQWLIEKGLRTKWVIIKMGSKGSLLISKSTISYAPSFKVNVVDTVGCGDSFTAAIAYGFLHSMPTINTIVLANAVGAATATGCGAGRNVANRKMVLQLLKQSNLNDDAAFWRKLVDEGVGRQKISLLSEAAINGSNDHLVHTPIQTVVAELLEKFNVCESEMVS